MKRLYHHNVGCSSTSISNLFWSLLILPTVCLWLTRSSGAGGGRNTAVTTTAFAFADAAKTSSTTSSSATPSATTPPTYPHHRPELVQQALAHNKRIYYFGLGSNMSREKIEQRTGSNITICSMEPAVVPGHRLAFNMRGFPPLEPGMGSLEPIVNTNNNNNNHNHDKQNEKRNDKTTTTTSRPLLAYDKEECHGALVQLSAEDYEKLMKTEGVGPHVKDPGYEEVVVLAYPYPKNRFKTLLFGLAGSNSLTTTTTTTQPVWAVALRARPHVRLLQDPRPSQRYMDILIKGAKELQLVDDYQDFLQRHPVQEVSRPLGKIAVYNLVFLSNVSFRWKKLRFLSKLQSWMIYRISSSSSTTTTSTSSTTSSLISSSSRLLSQVAMGVILFPGAIIGFGLLHYLRATGKLSPFMKQMVDRY